MHFLTLYLTADATLHVQNESTILTAGINKILTARHKWGCDKKSHPKHSQKSYFLGFLNLTG
jgi:hypothetical protein